MFATKQRSSSIRRLLHQHVIEVAGRSFASRPEPSKFVRFDWQDALNLSSLLTEEERLVRDTAKNYCQSKLMPRVTEGFRNESKTDLRCLSCSRYFSKISKYFKPHNDSLQQGSLQGNGRIGDAWINNQRLRMRWFVLSLVRPYCQRS